MSEVKQEIIEKTQKTLGKYITKPPLTEKLLKKPPFRFLHDVITSVIRDTGFLSGLYSENELVSDNVKERDAKIAFLTKAIDTVKGITGIELSVRPSKVIAGLEPVETNKFLQAIGTALNKKLDSTDYIKNLKTDKKLKSKVTKEKVKKSSRTSVKTEDKVSDSTRVKKREPVSETPKTDRSKKKEPTPREEKQSKKSEKHDKIKEKHKRGGGKEKDAKNEIEINKKSTKDRIKLDLPNTSDVISIESKTEIQENENTNENPDEVIFGNDLDIKDSNERNSVDNMANESVGETNFQNDNKQDETNISVEVTKKFTSRSDRPKSARPQSGDYKRDREISAKVNNIEDTRNKEVSEKIRPMSSLRPPSVRPASARPGAPRLRLDSALPLQEVVPLGKINVIVENYSTKETDEEETVIIQRTQPEPESQPVQQILDIPADKGHLVEQILEQIHGDDVAEHAKLKTDIDWEQEGFRNRDATSREIGQLRSSIQALTRVANPLGKLMNYLHEDVEAMHLELNMWTNMKRQMWSEINKQKRSNEESTKPLRTQLEELEDNINKQEDEIRNIRSNILRNEFRIKELLAK